MRNNRTIIISRTDSIGDVVLTLPVAGVLKKEWPGCRILFLGRTYTEPVITRCKYVDEFINYDRLAGAETKTAVDLLKQCNAGMILHVFPRRDIARLAAKAGIPLRIGTSHRIYHWFTCNRLVNLGRKNSDLHEAQLNLQLLRGAGLCSEYNPGDISGYYGFNRLPPPDHEMKYAIKEGLINLVIHPKTKGSAREWDVRNFIRLIHLLPADKYNIIITGMHEDTISLRPFFLEVGGRVLDMTGKTNIRQMISLLSLADGIVSCSTGPLHMAAAMGKASLGIYPSIRPMHAGRWGPLGANARAIMIPQSCDLCRRKNNCECINRITPEEVAFALQDLIAKGNH